MQIMIRMAKRCCPGKQASLALVVAVFCSCTSSVGAKDFNPPPPNPRNPVNYVDWLNKHVEPGNAQNAYDTYLKAFEKLTDFPDEKWSNDSPTIYPWLDQNREALDLFRQATQIKDFAFRWEPPGGSGDERIDPMIGNVKIHWLRPWRNASNGLCAAAWRAWSAGRQDVFVDDTLAALRSSQHLYGSLLLFGRLRGTADAAIAYRALAQAFAEAGDTDSLAAILAPRLSKDDPPISGLREQIMMEKLASWDFAQRLFVPDKSKPGTLTLYHPMLQWFADGGARPFSPLMQVAQTKIGFDGTIKTFNMYFDRMADWCDRPYHLTKPEDRERVERESFDHIRIETRNPLGLMIMVPLVHPRNLNEQIRATRRATHLIVHLFDHRRQHGAFPKRLSDLRISDLAQLRLDPFSGSDLKYRSDRKTFSLYSVGHNLKDDRGRHSLWDGDGDYVFWPVP